MRTISFGLLRPGKKTKSHPYATRRSKSKRPSPRRKRTAHRTPPRFPARTGLEADLFRDGLERLDEEGHVLEQRPPHRLGAAMDVAAVHAAREGLVLELLHHRFRRQVRELLARPHLDAGADEPHRLVA